MDKSCLTIFARDILDPIYWAAREIKESPSRKNIATELVKERVRKETQRKIEAVLKRQIPDNQNLHHPSADRESVRLLSEAVSINGSQVQIDNDKIFSILDRFIQYCNKDLPENVILNIRKIANGLTYKLYTRKDSLSYGYHAEETRDIVGGVISDIERQINPNEKDLDFIYEFEIPDHPSIDAIEDLAKKIHKATNPLEKLRATHQVIEDYRTGKLQGRE